jgi:hypothetical protein
VRRAREASGLRTHSAAKSTLPQLLQAMTQQALAGSGSLGHHLRLVMNSPISDSAAIQRRASLSWEFYQELFGRVLKPLARPKEHPESFHNGLRLLALDGSHFSLRNSSTVMAMTRQRPGNQRGQGGAFMKWSTAVLLELGTHAPLCVACSTLGLERMEMEIDIARRTLPALAQMGPSLLLADRLYGCASFMLEVMEQGQGRAHCLMRVRDNLRAQQLEVLSDGSALVRVRSDTKARRKAASCEMVVRELRADVQRAGGKAQSVRLWTTLVDAQKHPARELLELYARRWEQELFFRELKRHTGATGMLQADSEQTAQGAFAALVLAAGEVARRRVEAATEAELPVLRLSIAKMGQMLGQLTSMMQSAGDVLTPAQRAAMSRKWLQVMVREAVIPPRRKRSCQHGLRRPHSPWPVIRRRNFIDPDVLLTLHHATSP